MKTAPCWSFLLRLFLLALLAGPACGAVAVGGKDGGTGFDLAPASAVLEDPQGTLTLDQVRAAPYAGQFRPAPLHFGFSDSVFWIRITLRREAGDPATWWIDSGNRVLSELTVFAPQADGSHSAARVTSADSFTQRPVASANLVLPVTLAAGESTVYLRMRGSGVMPTTLTPQLWQPDAHLRHALREKRAWQVYIGMAAALCLFNLLMFVSIRDRILLLYAVSLLSIVWAVCSGVGGYGAAYEYLWPGHPGFERASWLVSILAANFFPFLFLSHFIGLRAAMPRVVTVVLSLMAVMGASIVFQTWALLSDTPVPNSSLMTANIIGPIAYSGQLMLMIGALAVLAWRGNRQARFISIAFVPVIAAAVCNTLQLNAGVAQDRHLIMLASAFELVLMSLAIADRINQEKSERVRAQSGMVDALRESERALEDTVAQRTSELRHEQVRTKELLHNILPVELADELTETGSARSARHESATILFTDFADFTQAVATMPADRVVAELNEIFAAFDDITDACGVEKIKTIGDAYMAAAGLPKPCSDHAQRCVSAALQMLAYVKARNHASAFKWSLRVGIHSGPVVSGVVGKRKYAFDIWGDSVNVASRMESSGQIGRVNVSAYTYDLIRLDYDCEYRGKVAAKGKGDMDMYFVDGDSAASIERKRA